MSLNTFWSGRFTAAEQLFLELARLHTDITAIVVWTLPGDNLVGLRRWINNAKTRYHLDIWIKSTIELGEVKEYKHIQNVSDWVSYAALATERSMYADLDILFFQPPQAGVPVPWCNWHPITGFNVGLMHSGRRPAPFDSLARKAKPLIASNDYGATGAKLINNNFHEASKLNNFDAKQLGPLPWQHAWAYFERYPDEHFSVFPPGFRCEMTGGFPLQIHYFASAVHEGKTNRVRMLEALADAESKAWIKCIIKSILDSESLDALQSEAILDLEFMRGSE